jgi:hypothetical protein
MIKNMIKSMIKSMIKNMIKTLIKSMIKNMFWLEKIDQNNRRKISIKITMLLTLNLSSHRKKFTSIHNSICKNPS